MSDATHAQSSSPLQSMIINKVGSWSVIFVVALSVCLIFAFLYKQGEELQRIVNTRTLLWPHLKKSNRQIYLYKRFDLRLQWNVDCLLYFSSFFLHHQELERSESGLNQTVLRWIPSSSQLRFCCCCRRLRPTSEPAKWLLLKDKMNALHSVSSGPVGSRGYCKHPWLEAGVDFWGFQSDVCRSQLLVPSWPGRSWACQDTMRSQRSSPSETKQECQAKPQKKRVRKINGGKRGGRCFSWYPFSSTVMVKGKWV